MVRIDRLIDSMPGTPETAGALAMLGGAAGMGIALTLANLPLAIGAFVLWAAGYFGPAMIKQKANPPDAALAASLEAEEDAAVEAFVCRMQAVGRFQAMAASEERPPRGRMH